MSTIVGRKVGGVLGKMPCVPIYTGRHKAVYLNRGKAGYIEVHSSGTLTWMDDNVPASVDLFCVGGGGGGGASNGGAYGGGGGSGYTSKALKATIDAQTAIAIGAGGGANAAGGTTSIGSLTAAGGSAGRSPDSYGSLAHGGDGGSGGGSGGGSKSYAGGSYSIWGGGPGGTNGGDGFTSNGSTVSGAGQGTPTTDLLGRVHAGGGAGLSPSSSSVTSIAYSGASDFSEGCGLPITGDLLTSGGGGYGGGGRTANSGGDGFAMVAWGDYSSAVVT